MRVGDFCQIKSGLFNAAEKSRLYGIKIDKVYYCYGIFKDNLILTEVNGNSNKVYSYIKKGEKYDVDYTNTIKVPAYIMIPTGVYLTSKEVTALKNKHMRWKDQIINKHDERTKHIDRTGNNKQYIQIVSGGAVSPR